ncbi:transmembrane 4 L6 family member 20 [Spea bombifrons]|uniref:transmembrane 4 L6 family member 20 n=1 Tax=Spea bombifrons TaxID=233779 RepID=UPI00234AA9E1|nr:transmembrane 4 L6 family member 20 [Spea bombifrons]
MTCVETWTSCNGFFLLILALLAIAFNLTPLIADYVEDGRLLYSPISCYEWWLPGLVGGGLLVLPAVAMSLAARKKGSCNSRCGMLASSLLSLVGIIGAAYCSILSIFAIGQGPLICETGSNDISKCDYTLANISSFGDLKFDLAWFLNTTCLQTHDPGNATTLGMVQERFYDLKLNEDTQKIIHITVFVALAIIGLLEGVVGISQTAAGLFGFICGTSKKNRNDYDD